MSPVLEIVAADAITPKTMPAPTAPASSSSPAETPSPPSPALDTSKTDRAGIVFDPARHIEKQHPTTGRWMPKGGRKVLPRIIDTAGTPPAPEKPAPSFIPKDVPPAPAVEGEPAKGTGTPPAPDLADNSDAAAECAARGLQYVAGTIFDDHDATTPPAKEHESMVRSFAAYIRSKGWQASAGVSVGLVVVAWLLRVLQKDKPREKVKSWLNPAARARNVTPPKADDEKQPAQTPAAPPPDPKNKETTVQTLNNLEVIE